MAAPFSKQDHVTLPNGKSTNKLLFEALVVFFSTELTDENARSFPTEYQFVQRWRTTRKTPQASRLEDFVKRIPNLHDYIIFDRTRGETQVQVDLYEDLILASSKSESESESSFKSLEFPTKTRISQPSNEDATKHDETAQTGARGFQPEKLNLEDEGEKRRVAAPTKEATAGGSTTVTKKDGVSDLSVTKLLQKEVDIEPQQERERGSLRRTTDADLIDLHTPKKILSRHLEDPRKSLGGHLEEENIEENPEEEDIEEETEGRRSDEIVRAPGYMEKNPIGEDDGSTYL